MQYSTMHTIKYLTRYPYFKVHSSLFQFINIVYTVLFLASFLYKKNRTATRKERLLKYKNSARYRSENNFHQNNHKGRSNC